MKTLGNSIDSFDQVRLKLLKNQEYGERGNAVKCSFFSRISDSRSDMNIAQR